MENKKEIFSKQHFKKKFFEYILKNDEDEYRQYYLEEDAHRAKIVIFILLFPTFFFSLTDYKLFDFSNTFYYLSVIRLIQSICLLSLILFLSKIKKYKTYDNILLITSVVSILCVSLINMTRPSDYIQHQTLDIIFIFILYFIINTKIIYRIISGLLLTLSSFLILCFFKQNLGIIVWNITILSYIIVNVVSISISSHLQNYRRLQFIMQKEKEKLSKQLLETKDQFITVITHDIKSPFSAILASSDLLINQEELSEEQKQLVRIIKEGAAQQLDYINDLLDYLILGKGEIKLSCAYCSLDNMIDEVVQFYEQLALKKQLSILKENSIVNKVYVDELKLKQVLNNLLSNAIKFSYQNGVIKIHAFEKEPGKVEIHVKDNGMGVNEKIVKLLFKENARISTVGTALETGTGFGLKISKAIIELHGGTIGFASNKENGSDFWFNFPVNAE